MAERKFEEFDTVITGGGIIGCSIAYHVARAGIPSVLVLERNSLASGATSRAAALLTQARAKACQTPLALRTHAAISELEEELGDPMGLRRTGSLHVAATPERYQELVGLVRIAEQYGISFAWLDRPEAEWRVPWLNASMATGLVLMPDDAFVDPYLLAHGYARAARSRGVIFRPGQEVTSIVRNGTAVQGVRTPEGEIRARCVVDAGGAWAGLLAWELGVRLPMAPVRSHYWIIQPESSFPADMPYAILPDANAYVRPELGGLILGLREADSLSVDPHTIPSNLAGVPFGDEEEGWNIYIEGSERLRRFYPALDEARFNKFITGLSTYTPDGQFVIGPVPHLDGYLVASGCCGAGIAVSGGIGLAIAELVGGKAASFDLKPYRADRFGPIDPSSQEFRARCAATRSAKVSG